MLMALSTVLAVGTASPAGAACSAGVAPDAEFTGTVIAIDGGNVERDELDGRTHTAALDARTTFEVDEWLVGGGPSGGPSEVVVVTNGASGGGSFQMVGDERPVVELGERWHVAAYQGDPADDTLDAACGGSTRVAAPPPGYEPPGQGSLPLREILAAVVAFVAAGLVIRRVRRDRTPQPDASAPTP